MLTFELYRQLDIRMFQTVSVADSTYGACAKYILDGDNLILLGSDHSIRLNIPSKGLTKDVPLRNWDIETEAMLWFSEDSNEAVVIRMICNAYRQFLGVDPYGTAEEFSALMDAANARLAQYDLKMLVDEAGMCIFHEDLGYTFEDAVNLIMDIDENRMDNGGMVELINEALYYRKVDKMEEAAQRLEKVVRYADHTQPIYTDSLFLLGETYYYSGNFERAAELYYRCHMEFIEDEDDFYIHLGHALLDERMKKYERQIRIYYRGIIDAEYADTHAQAIAAAGTEIAEVFDEYQTTCLDMGRKKYAEFRNNLPVGADDIDELLIFEKVKEGKSEETVKRYEGIRLIEPTRTEGTMGRNIHEMLSSALSLFLGGDYQEAFEIYYRLREEVTADSDQATWIFYMLGKMYCIFGEPQKAMQALAKCDPNRFGNVYRLDDFLILYDHVRIVCEDFESDERFGILLRGRLDNYFSQYDRNYNMLLRDRKLMKNYRDYESEREMTSRKAFADVIRDDEPSTEREKIKDLKRFFFKKK